MLLLFDPSSVAILVHIVRSGGALSCGGHNSTGAQRSGMREDVTHQREGVSTKSLFLRFCKEFRRSGARESRAKETWHKGCPVQLATRRGTQPCLSFVPMYMYVFLVLT